MDDRLELALEEYKTLRQEILNSITAQYTILTFGAVAVGVLTNAVLREPGGSRSAPAEVLFTLGGLLVGIPLLCLVVVVMWMNEVTRMLRAGLFIRGLEVRMNALVKAPATVFWENTVHKGDGPDIEKNHFRLVVLFFGTLALAFAASGAFRLWQAERLPLWIKIAVTLVEVVLVALGGRLLLGAADGYRKMREDWRRGSSASTAGPAPGAQSSAG